MLHCIPQMLSWSFNSFIRLLYPKINTFLISSLLETILYWPWMDGMDNPLIFVNFTALWCCYFSQQSERSLPSLQILTYSRQNSNRILEMTSGFQPHIQCVFHQSSWTCVCLWQHVCLLFAWLNILMQTFHCFCFWPEVSKASRQIACGFPLMIASISLKCQQGMQKHVTPRLPLSHWMHLHDVTLLDWN